MLESLTIVVVPREFSGVWAALFSRRGRLDTSPSFSRAFHEGQSP